MEVFGIECNLFIIFEYLFIELKRFFKEEFNLLYCSIKYLVRLIILLLFFLFVCFLKILSVGGRGILLYNDKFMGGFLKIKGLSLLMNEDIIFFLVIN